MLLACDGTTIGEKWKTVLPSKIDVEFFLQCIGGKLNCQNTNYWIYPVAIYHAFKSKFQTGQYFW